jgi:ATP-dependent helicase IRC3
LICNLYNSLMRLAPHRELALVGANARLTPWLKRGGCASVLLSEAMLAANAPAQIAEGFTKLALGRRAIIFCPSVGIVNSMALHLRQAGLAVATVVGDTETEERHDIYRRLRQGQLDALVSCMVLTEGFDEPSVDCVVLARPTQSKVLFFQTIGRGLRLSPDTGKQDCLLIDATGATERHGLLSMAAQLGLLRQDDEAAMERTETRAGAKKEMQEVEGSYRIADIDVSPNLLHWVTTAKGYYVVKLADRMLRIRPDSEETYTLEARVDRELRYQPLATQLSLDYCFGIASDTARDAKILHMVQRDAAWRGKARSPKQETLARKLGIAIDPTWRSGDISDAINRHIGDWYDRPAA